MVLLSTFLSMKTVYQFENSQRLALHLHADSHGMARLQLGIEASRSGLLAEGTSHPDLYTGSPCAGSMALLVLRARQPRRNQHKLHIGSSSEALASAVPACVNCTANPLHSYMQMCAGRAPVVDALSKVSCMTTLALQLRTQLQRSRDTNLKG